MEPSGPTWRRRRERAATYLDDSARIGELGHIVGALRARSDAGAAVVAGLESVTAAARVGILSGSFNPLTIAHTALANAARAQCGLDTVLWTCAVVTIDKERVARATLTDRLCQLAAFADSTGGGATLVANRGLYADQARLVRASVRPDTKIWVIVGFDKVAQIFDPRYYQDRDAALRELFSVASLAVAPRDGHSEHAVASLLAQPQNRPYADHVTYLQLAGRYMADSSSEARALARSPAGGRAALRKLLTPEGFSLTKLMPFEDAGQGEVDTYEWRIRWQEALAGPLNGRRLPQMSALVSAATGATATAAALRRGLAHPEDVSAQREMVALVSSL